MKRFLVALTALACTCFANVTSAAVVNGGFETGGLGPWFVGSTSGAMGSFETWNVTSSDANTGTYSVTGTNNIEIRQNFSAIAADDITEISIFAKIEIGSIPISFMSLFYADGTSQGSVFTGIDSEWVEFDLMPLVSAGKNLIGFSAFGNTGACPGANCARLFLDDFTVRTTAAPVPVPAGMLFLVSAIGVGALMRRKQSATS